MIGKTNSIIGGGGSTYKLVDLGEATFSSASNTSYTHTFDASSIPGYRTLTAEDFILDVTGFAWSGSGTNGYEQNGANRGFSKLYNNGTGILTVTGLTGYASGRDYDYHWRTDTCSVTIRVYCKR